MRHNPQIKYHSSGRISHDGNRALSADCRDFLAPHFKLDNKFKKLFPINVAICFEKHVILVFLIIKEYKNKREAAEKYPLTAVGLIFAR